MDIRLSSTNDTLRPATSPPFSRVARGQYRADQLQKQYVIFLVVAVLLFLLGVGANLAIIVRVLRQGVLRARIRLLLFCLTLADLLFILIEFPINQFTWLLTETWTTGPHVCRLSAFSRAFAAFLITFIMVVMR
uniref:G-protein coupled receptors family 1 profile domain-containing protein n=1 Tax=Romanomermis culicivorax TaxID=13658 RepID=A0A915HFU1_ROMCU